MEEEVEEGLPAWMGTFADLMSLLLTFFVLLLSFANMDIMKFEGMVGSMKEAFGVKFKDPGDHLGFTDSIVALFDEESVAEETMAENEDRLSGELKRISTQHQVAGSVSVLSGKGGIIVRVDGKMLFRPGESDVAPAAFVFLDEMAAVMRQFEYDVSVEGHTDSTARGKSHRSNLPLGAARANSAAQYLVGAGGVPAARMSIVSYGDSKPVDDNNTAKGRARNRRIEFVFHRQEPRSPNSTNR